MSQVMVSQLRFHLPTLSSQINVRPLRRIPWLLAIFAMSSTLSSSRSSRLTERCGYRWLKSSAASITAISCLTKAPIISRLPCFHSLRLRTMKRIVPEQPATQNAKLLCVTMKKRGVSLVMSVLSCGLSSSSRNEFNMVFERDAPKILCVGYQDNGLG